MVNLAELCDPPRTPTVNRMSDGSEIFPYLWRYFLHHEPLRDWLMRVPPYASASFQPRNVAQGIAFCCNFTVPTLWADLAASFDLGEMFIPDHSYSHFMCGTVVAATSLHKHLICALGPAASRQLQCLPSYQTAVRRMIVDTGSSRSINIIEFSWMQDGNLIVTTKILVPPDPSVPYQAAGCTGAFALFQNVMPGGPTPTVPRSLVSFVEAPRCPFCTARGSLGCYCSGSLAARSTREDDAYSSAIWPPRMPNDVKGDALDTYHKVRSRLDLIQHVAHVKITAHVVTTQEVTRPSGPPAKTYKLGPSRFVIKAVLFRPSNSLEADTLRQVADKLRMLRAGSLSISAALQKEQEESKRKRVRIVEGEVEEIENENEGEQQDFRLAVDLISCPSVSQPELTGMSSRHFPPAVSVQSSRASTACGGCGKCGSGNRQCTMSSSFLTSNVTQSRSVSVNDVGSRVTESLSAAEIMPAKRLQCPRCDKSFSQQGSLNRHLKNIHDARKIPCEFCSMSFGQMFDLKRHQRRKHAEKYSPNVRGERADLRVMRETPPSAVH